MSIFAILNQGGMKNLRYYAFLPLSLLCAFPLGSQLKAQVNASNINGGDINTITTAVPFLSIGPDSRAGGMGDVGVATSADVNSIHWNPAKLVYTEKDMGFGISYTPWLRALVPDISLSYLSFYKKIDRRGMSAVGGSLRYFTLGDIQFTDNTGANTIQVRPNEFALDLAYSRKLSDRFSGGLAIRFINSNLTQGQNVQGADSRPGRTVAADVSVYYQSDEFELFGKDAEWAWGANISNIGAKVSYTETTKRDFIPINLRLGPRLTFKLDDANELAFTVDINKLLVPTPPIYLRDTAGGLEIDDEGNPIILAGADPERAVASGMFGSFTDAPGTPVEDANGNVEQNADGTAVVEGGSVFREEMREFMFAFGAEYWYDKQFSVRAGYFWEHATKGNRKYITLGAGLRYNVFGLDFSYLIPAYFSANNTQQSPLQNTLRFSLTFDLEGIRSGLGGDGNNVVE